MYLNLYRDRIEKPLSIILVVFTVSSRVSMRIVEANFERCILEILISKR